MEPVRRLYVQKISCVEKSRSCWCSSNYPFDQGLFVTLSASSVAMLQALVPYHGVRGNVGKDYTTIISTSAFSLAAI